MIEERTVDVLQDALHKGKSSGLRKEGMHLAEEPLCVKVEREVLKTEKGPMMQFPTTIHPHSQRALNINLKPALTPTWKPRHMARGVFTAMCSARRLSRKSW